LDVLEEGQFPLDKYCGHWIVPAPTTIIATANPIQSYWSNSEIVSKDDINIRKTLLDRFQQTFIFRKQMSKELIHDLAMQMSVIRKRKPHNYNFLRKYLIYASGIKSKKITAAAEQMLNEFWEEAKLHESLENRMLNGLFSMAEAQAKLYLKDIVDEEIATEIMESVQLMTVQYGEMLKTISNPKIVTYNKFLEILQNNKAGVSIKELCKIACYENRQISAYLGTSWSVEHNHCIRIVVDMLRNNDKIKEVKRGPIVLQWVVSDNSENSDDNSNVNIADNDSKEMELQSQTVSDMSDMSDRNQGKEREATEDMPYGCPSCGFSDPDRIKRDEHIESEHK
jgi:hypothetical protein